MKAKEIKIGDWISFADVPVKVKDIKPKSVLLDISRFDDCMDKEGCAELGDIRPIPLTEEILEKNGRREDDELWDIDYAFGQLHIEFFSNGKDIEAMVSVTDGRDVCCLRQIKYTHELQHILWALGMDDNLKI